MSYILHIERHRGKLKYKFKMEVPAQTRPEALRMFNDIAAKHDGTTRLLSCRPSDYGEPK